MGMFLHTAVWNGRDLDMVHEALEKLSEGENPLQIYPAECELRLCDGGTLVLMNPDCAGYETLAEGLSRELQGAVLVGTIYDGDFWDYFFYDRGEELSRFSSFPDYFEELEEEEWKRWSGNAGILEVYFSCPAARLEPYLRPWTEENEGEKAWDDDRFESGDCMQLFDFLARLGFGFPLEEVPEDWKSAGEPEGVEEGERSNSYQAFNPPSWTLWEQQAQEKEYAELPQKLSVNLEFVENVRVWQEEGETLYPKEALTEELFTGLLEGKWRRLAVDFWFQGEGVYVKKLKKKVYRPFHSILVLHQDADGYACLFFAGGTGYCHMLIGDFYAYMEVDSKDIRKVRVGDAELPEYGVHKDRERIDKALRALFMDPESADKRFYDSKLWSTNNISGGVKMLEKYLREWGLPEEG